MQTKQEKIENYLLDKVFDNRPGKSTDWIDFMTSAEADEVEGFVPESAYTLDNAEAIRGVLSSKLQEAYALVDLLVEKPSQEEIPLSLTRITTIAGVPVDEKLFDNEEVAYRPVDREEQIDDLITWISEIGYFNNRRQNDKFLMKQDLEYLMSIRDEVIFSAIGTNEFIAQSDNPKKFKEICQDILLASGLTEEGVIDALSGECL